VVLLTWLRAAPVVVTGHPPTSPEHGLNETAFAPLFSNDTDEFTVSDLEGNHSHSALRELALGTDIPLDRPPRAVEQWNRGEHGEFPQTNRGVSAAPTHANLEQGRYIRDAHVTFVSVQPSTVVHTSKSERTLYVSPSGEVLGVIDFRVRTPGGSRSANRTVSHSVTETRINETQLLVDDRVVATENRMR
jgi:hypothetical protein